MNDLQEGLTAWIIPGEPPITSYGWLITKDVSAEDDMPIYDEDERSLSGTTGPRNIGPIHIERLGNGEGEEFRMLDDDRNVYYEGRIVGAYNGFEPLDDFGCPNAGCTIIQYRNKQTKQWEDL